MSLFPLEFFLNPVKFLAFDCSKFLQGMEKIFVFIYSGEYFSFGK